MAKATKVKNGAELIQALKKIKGILQVTTDSKTGVIKEVYTNKLPKAKIQVGKQSFELDIEVSSTESDDEVVLHKLHKETDVI